MLACVASISERLCRESWKEGKKEEWKGREGEGDGGEDKEGNNTKFRSWFKILSRLGIMVKVLFWLDCASDLSSFWKTATPG